MTRILLAAVLCLACSGAPQPPSSPTPEPAPVTVQAPIGIPNARLPWPDVLVGGQPTEEHLREAARRGYRTIVNLRAPGEAGLAEEDALVSGLGLRYVPIPVAGAGGLTPEAAAALDRVMSAPEDRPVMIHCASGNRVGALLALRAGLIDGASTEEALELGRRAGLTRLEPRTREILASAIPEGARP